MKKPRIGIVADKARRVPPYQTSVEQADGEVEIILPDNYSPDIISRLDGILLTGGGDIAPEEFGEPQHPKTSFINRDRDRMEIELARVALEKDIPLFGVCRGLQVMNVALGGTLIQDIPDDQPSSEISHDDQSRARDEVAHTVRIDVQSLLYSLLKSETISVNSFHHQAIDRIASGLVATAWSEDGIIEGIEKRDQRFYLGVQWHPEEFYRHPSTPFAPLFRALVEASRK